MQPVYKLAQKTKKLIFGETKTRLKKPVIPIDPGFCEKVRIL